MWILSIFLWIGVAVGHTAVMIGGVNQWYGRPLPHRFLSVVRTIHAALVPALLIGLWWVYGWDLASVLERRSPVLLHAAIVAYVVACCVITYLLLPAITVYRLRRRPAALVHNHTCTLDIAEQLGFAPVGHSRYRPLAKLPWNEVFRVDFAEKELRLPRLPPALDGITILHLSDLHFSGTPDREFYMEVMNVCGNWEPDLLAITGDVVDSDHHHRWILPVLSRLRWRVGAYAILGNHDTWYEPALVRRRLRRLGIDVLGNCWKSITVRGETMVISGNETPWIRPAPEVSRCPAGVFHISLSHTPDNLPWAKQHGIDLMLAGHNHGGQIRLPLFGSILVPSRHGRRYDCGTFDEPPTVLHVVRGLAAQHPLRYNCRPEIALLTLLTGAAV